MVEGHKRKASWASSVLAGDFRVNCSAPLCLKCFICQVGKCSSSWRGRCGACRERQQCATGRTVKQALRGVVVTCISMGTGLLGSRAHLSLPVQLQHTPAQSCSGRGVPEGPGQPHRLRLVLTFAVFPNKTVTRCLCFGLALKYRKVRLPRP